MGNHGDSIFGPHLIGGFIEDLALQPAPFSRVRSTRLDRRILRIDLFEIDLLQPHIVHGGLDSPQPKHVFFYIFTQYFFYIKLQKT
jgi:hypothetical protein